VELISLSKSMARSLCPDVAARNETPGATLADIIIKPLSPMLQSRLREMLIRQPVRPTGQQPPPRECYETIHGKLKLESPLMNAPGVN